MLKMKVKYTILQCLYYKFIKYFANSYFIDVYRKYFNSIQVNQLIKDNSIVQKMSLSDENIFKIREAIYILKFKLNY